jgi:TatD DNase family protein
MTTAPVSLVDTHCHLALLAERGLLDAALESAVSSGLERIVSIGLDLEDSDRTRALAEEHGEVVFTVGWHPHCRRPPDAAELAAMRSLLDHPRAVALGEIGLDLYFRPGYHETPLEVQLRSLRAMLDLAEDADKPVVVHDREAHREIVEVLGAFARRRGASLERPVGVLHCFSGDEWLAEWAVEHGFLCSFAGPVTFPGSHGLRRVAARLDDRALVVETDAPFLAPVPHRGEPNLPGYVVHTARALATARGQSLETIAATTSANARRLFRLAVPAAGSRGGTER